LVVALLTGCGNNTTDPNAKTFPFLTPADPLVLTDNALTRGVGVYSGEPLAFALNEEDLRANSTTGNFPKIAAATSHAMLHLKSYDELTQDFGEYVYYGIRQSEPQRSPGDFINQPGQGDLSRRALDLNSELDAALMRVDLTGLEQRSVVVDFFRTRGDWYVRWDGLLTAENRMGKGAYGLGREDMYNDLLDELGKVARNLEPSYFIVGDGMERLLAGDGGSEGISPGEWANFVSFYRDAYDTIKEASPNTRVGVGINWDRFATDVVRYYVPEGDIGAEEIDVAFTNALLPLLSKEAERNGAVRRVVTADIIALSSYAAEDDPAAKGYYQFLRRLPALYGLEQPVVFYSIGSPVDSRAGEPLQGQYIEAFADWVGGVDVEAIFWERMIDIDGSNAAGGMVAPPCGTLVSSEGRAFELPLSRCFDGLFDATFEVKAPFGILFP